MMTLCREDVPLLSSLFECISAEDGFAPEDPMADSYLLGQLCLIHSEVSEAVEAYRRGLKDSHLPHREGMDVELADVVIRVIKLCHHRGIPLADLIVEKELYNRSRTDHTPETRAKPGGKKF